jgi:hypothetical protein
MLFQRIFKGKHDSQKLESRRDENKAQEEERRQQMYEQIAHHRWHHG